MNPDERPGDRIPAPLLYAVFLVSGFAAILYQLVWQRSLFRLLGTSSESVTMVVTAFMLGLGLGSLAGGAVTVRTRWALPVVFGAVELGIGAFGLISMPLFTWIASFTSSARGLTVGLIAFVAVLVPTLFMGGTLPILVVYLVRRSGNVGKSVGLLYFVNTLGSALGSLAAAGWILGRLGQAGSVLLAAAMNLLVAAAVIGLHRFPPEGGMIPALALAFLSGAIALSYEILWYRAFSFASGSRADTFGLMLGSYLLGLALGSLAVRRWCREADAGARRRLLGGLVLLTLLSNGLGYFVVPVLAWTVGAGLRWEYGLGVVGLAAAALGSLFPLITHAWIPPDEKVGRNVSVIYLANILGSTLGSLLTGFVLMDHLTLGGMHVFLVFLGLGMAAILAALAPRQNGVPAAVAIAVFAGAAGVYGLAPFDGVYERLQEKGGYVPGRRFTQVVETRSGVITVNDRAQIFGGGIYDGAFNTSLQDDKNSIIRCYALAELHPAPKDVLMIGLSSGSWGTVIADHPGVERFTIVEINDGYLRLLPKYPDVAGLPVHPKVTIEIDDGRRWMVRNPGRKFDLIVANATFHWRSNATNLLSKEFLELARSRLKPGGVYYYNTTGSLRAVKTGCDVFSGSMRVGGFLAVSDSPLEIDLGRLRERLFDYPRNGGPLLDRALPGDVATMEAVLESLKRMIHRRPELLTATRGCRLITDDNMGTEWEGNPEQF